VHELALAAALWACAAAASQTVVVWPVAETLRVAIRPGLLVLAAMAALGTVRETSPPFSGPMFGGLTAVFAVALVATVGHAVLSRWYILDPQTLPASWRNALAVAAVVMWMRGEARTTWTTCGALAGLAGMTAASLMGGMP
jgi:hypothetical protein